MMSPVFKKRSRPRPLPSSRRFGLTYKLLLNHPEVVKDLIVGFLDRFGSDRFDFDTLFGTASEFVTEDLRVLRSDWVWGVQLRDSGRRVYLMFEIRHRVDRNIMVHLSECQLQLHEAIDRVPAMVGPSGEPPIIIPVVIHNSRGEWPIMPGMVPMRRDGSDADAWESMFWPGMQPLRSFRLDLRHFSREDLQPFDNLVSYMIALERGNQPPETVTADLRGLLDLLRSMGNSMLAKSFCVWANEILPVNRDALDAYIFAPGWRDRMESTWMAGGDPAEAQDARD